MILENERLHQQIAELTAQRDESRAERDRAREAATKENDEVCQILGRALGYPWFRDDQANFPGATEADGVCVGDHVGASIADEAVQRIRRITAERDELLSVARELIESTDTEMEGPTEAAMVDGAPFDRLKALVRRAAGLDRGEG